MISFEAEDAAAVLTSKSCLSCKNYLSCKDPDKAFSYLCSKFQVMSMKNALAQVSSTLGVEDRTKVKHVAYAPGSEFNIRKTIINAIANSPLVASDIKIDDGAFPEAPNFFTFCTSEKYLNQKPYLEQAIIGIIMFAEYCPRCTDMEWLMETHKVTDSLGKLKRKVALLEHGVCPYCTVKRDRLVKKYDLNYYREMAACCGQRSGKSALVSLMFAYITHRFIKLQNPNEVYGLMRSNVLHFTFVAVTFKQAKENLWDPFYGNILESPWFCIAEGSEIDLASGETKPIETMQVGDGVKTFEGTSVVDKVFDNGYQECFEVELEDGKVLPGTKQHGVQCLGADGASLVWKKIEDLTTDDLVVTN